MSPRWSIIIPTYRRPGALTRCLQSLTELADPRNAFEVIVVNDGGDPLDAVGEIFRDSLNLRIIDQPNSGPGAARNYGATHASGEFIAFTDDDCMPDPRWLVEFDARMNADPDCVAGGCVVNVLQGYRNLCSVASQSLVSYLYEYYNDSPEGARFFTSNNIAVQRTRFRDFGGFDAAYHRAAAEDRELCDRWTQAGRKLIYTPAAMVRHAHQLSVPAFVRQHFQYGRGALHFRQSRAARDAEPVRIEPARFYTRLLTYPKRSRDAYPLSTAALLFLAQGVNAAGFFYEKYFGPPLPPGLQPGAARAARPNAGYLA